MERFLKGLAIVLLLSAIVWVFVRGPLRRASAPPPNSPAVSASPSGRGTKGEGPSSGKIEEGERAVTTLPPLKLIREQRRTVRSPEPPPPK